MLYSICHVEYLCFLFYKFFLPFRQHCIKIDLQWSQASSLVCVLGRSTSHFLNFGFLTCKVETIPILPTSPIYCEDPMKL